MNINAGERAAPDSADWNGDGRKDLIIGNMAGNVIIYLNKGTDAQPLFDTSFALQVNGRIFSVGTRSAPRVYDWNRDGLNDLLLGEAEGYVYYLKNEGTRTGPLFSKAEKLHLRNGDFLRYPHPSGFPRSRVYVTDWNNDGHDDVLLGGIDGRVLLFLSSTEQTTSPAVFAKLIFNQVSDSAVRFKNRVLGKIRGLKNR